MIRNEETMERIWPGGFCPIHFWVLCFCSRFIGCNGFKRQPLNYIGIIRTLKIKILIKLKRYHKKITSNVWTPFLKCKKESEDLRVDVHSCDSFSCCWSLDCKWTKVNTLKETLMTPDDFVSGVMFSAHYLWIHLQMWGEKSTKDTKQKFSSVWCHHRQHRAFSFFFTSSVVAVDPLW